jgi:CRP-like cAMP-binding protein
MWYLEIESKRGKELLTSFLFAQILQAGTYGDCMYFLGIGTVAIMTPTGKEVCHLEDGDHFGEISLFANNDKRTASVVAIDYCEIYRLGREDFRKTIATVPDLYERIKDQGLRRMDATVVMEEHHKRRMLLAFSKEGDNEAVRNDSIESDRMSQDFNMDMSQFEVEDEANENSL